MLLFAKRLEADRRRPARNWLPHDNTHRMTIFDADQNESR
jgi:hypothetical protein